MKRSPIDKKFICLFIFLCVSQKIFANSIENLPIIFLSDSTSFQKIANSQIGYIEDFEERITKEVIDNQVLTPLETRSIFDITQRDFKYWAVLKIGSQADYVKTLWLDVPGNYVHAWVQRGNGSIEKYYTGNLLSRKEKTIKGVFRNFNYIPIELKANEVVTVKLNIKTNKFFPIYKDEINLGTPTYFEKFQYQRLSGTSFLDGLYSAIMLLFCLYCLGYFLFTKEAFAFWVGCYSLFLVSYFYQFNSTWYRFGVSPIFVQQAGLLFMTCSLLCNLFFTRSYINFKSTFPKLYKVYSFAIYIGIAFLLFQAVFYFITKNYLYTILLVLVIHTILYIPILVLGFKLLKFNSLYIRIFSLGIVLTHLLLLFNNSQLENVRNDLLKLAVSIYIVSIMLSLSFRAAKILKEKISAEAEGLLERENLNELQKLDSLKSSFFANVSHELRTPLTLMLGPISSVLKNDQLSNLDFTLLKKAQLYGQDLLKLIGSILDLSKLESSKMELKESPELLYPFSRRIAATFESYAEHKQIQYHFSYLAEKGLYVAIDKEKLTVILNNLLSNAFKFTTKGGKVDFLVSDEENALKFVVTDSGRGIHTNDLPHIFNRFYQTNQLNAPTEGGTGIGLALCKEFANLMGREIKVESELGKGSTFTLYINRKEVLGTIPKEKIIETELGGPVNDTPFSNTIAEETNKSTNPTTILIVEDNLSLREYLSTILSPYYTLELAENGKEALAILNNKLKFDTKNNSLPNLILSDIMMPLMDGFQLLNEIKAKDSFRSIPLIMLTAKADMETKLAALRIGVDDYLLKPFEEDELLARIENLLSNSQERAVFNNLTIKEEKQTLAQISQEESEWLVELEALVQNYYSDNRFSISQMAKLLTMSERNLQRQLKKLTGLTPNQYLQEIRLIEARKFLEQRRFDTISKVAFAVGYSDAKAFSRRFKIRFGKSPSAY